MKTAIVFTAMLLAAAPDAAAQSDLANFFPLADSVTEHPAFRHELTTFCQVKVGNRWVSFVGFKSTRTVLLVTFTLDSLANPAADVSLTVGYNDATPTLGKVSTWGYPFDRNGDGKIDYLALAGGAAPFEDRDFPPDYPKRGEQLMMPHLELFVAKCKIVFNHWADDNFDGKLDGVVQVDMDPLRNWVYRRILARSLKFNRKFDDVVAFRPDPSAFSDSISFTPESVPYIPVGMTASSLGWKDLDDKSAIMDLMNEAVRACGKGAFRLSAGYRQPTGQE